MLQERQRRAKQPHSRSSHAPPEFWGPYSPGHQNRFESFYRTPKAQRVPSQVDMRRVHEEVRKAMDTDLAREQPSPADLHRMVYERERAKRDAYASILGVAALALSILVLLLRARKL